MKTKSHTRESHTRESHTRNTHTRESRTRVIWDFKLWFGGRIWDLGFRTLVRGVGSGIPNFGSGGRIRDFKLWFGGSDPGFQTLVRWVGSGIVGVGSSGGKVGQIGKLAEIRRF